MMSASAVRLLEREPQRARFARRAEAARAGAGSTLVLEGPAGIGKTALLRDLAREARGLGMRVVMARGAELERDHAFGAALQWAEAALRGLDEEERAAALAGAAGLVGDLVGAGRAATEPAAGSGYPLLHGLYWLAANLAGRRPLLLALDDAHWADEPSLRAVAFLARRASELPMLLLLSARPDESSPTLAALAGDPDVETIALAPLGDAAGAELVGAELGRPPDAAFAAACRRATGGNPFLLTELARDLRARGIAPDAASAVLVHDLGPEPVARALRARLAGLPAEARALARALAVLEEADLPLAGALAGLDPMGAGRAAEALAAAGILEGGHPARFLHPILRAATLAGLPAGERDALHARAAELLRERGAPVERVAAHLLAAPPRGDPRAVADLRAAGERALARGAPEEAALALARALQEAPEPAGRAELLLALASAERALGRPEAAERFREAAETAADPRIRARAAGALPWALGAARAHAAEAALVDEAIAAVEPVDAELALDLLGTRIAFGLLDRSLAVPPERLEALAGLDPATPARVALLAHVARELMELGRPAGEAAAPAERAAAEAGARGGLNPDGSWLLNLFVVLHSADRPAALAPTLDWALAASRERGSAEGFVLAARLRATAALRAGRVADAEADARSALDVGLTEPYAALMPLAPLIGALIERGLADEAWGLLAERGVTGEVPAARPFSVLLLERAWLRQERGDLEGALADLEQARRRVGRKGASPAAGLDGRLREVEVLRLLGRAGAAREAAGEALARARRWGTPGHVGSALRAAALLEEGEAAIAGLRGAVAELERSPARLERARALIDLGAALRRAGGRSEAREPLRAGLALTDGGAEALAARARAELAASGARAARPAAGGTAALTPSERRIAEMAAGGLGNPEIAQALFVTRKTVEMHLGNAYRKLGIRSRAGLAAALDDRQSGAHAGGLDRRWRG